MNDCVFCKIIQGDIPADKVYENDKIIAFLDIQPINKGHTLIVPKKHFADFLDTPEDVLCEMMTSAKKIAAAAVKAVDADGFNIGINTKPAAGQIVMHMHLHVMPRFNNDGLKHWPGKTLTKEEFTKIRDQIARFLKH